MTTLFVTAFPVPVTSTNGGGLWDNATGTITFGTANARASGSWVQLAGSASIARAGKNFSSAVNGLTLSVYFKITSMPTTTTNLLMLNATDGVYAAFRYNQTNNRFAMIVVGGTEVDITTITPTTNQWYRLDMTATWNANPHTVDWSIDGTAGPQATFASAASTLTNFRLGNNDSKTWTAQYTDLIITDDTGDYPIGEHDTALLYPSADGTHDNAANCIEYEDGTDVGTAYDRINTVSTPNTSPSTTTYLRVTTASAGKYVEVALNNMPSGTPLGVRAFIAYTSETTTANNAGAVIMDGATERAIKGSTGSYVDWSDGSTANLYYASADIALASMDKTSVDAMTFRFISGDDASPDPYLIDMWAEVAYVSSTVYEQSASGALTPSGALIKQALKALAGSLAPAGTLALQILKAFSGSIAPSGALSSQTEKQAAGSLTPTGTLSTAKSTPSSGTGSVTPAGSLLLQIIKALVGSIAPVGTLALQTLKAFSGSITPSGALAAVKTAVSSVSGALTPVGTLLAQALKSLSGLVTPDGELTKQIIKSLSGSIIPTGELTKQTNKNADGSLTPSGALATIKAFLRDLTGSLTPTGDVNKSVSKSPSGTAPSSGDVDKDVSKSLTGDMSPTGDAAKSTAKSFTGSLTPSGVLSSIRAFAKGVSGSLSPSGNLTVQTQKSPSGQIQPSGALIKQTLKTLAGSITPAGALSAVFVPGGTVYTQSVAGSTTPSGILATLFVPGVPAVPGGGVESWGGAFTDDINPRPRRRTTPEPPVDDDEEAMVAILLSRFRK